MAKIVVHIGMHKTGSTAIQYYLATNRDLFKSLGVAYPQFEDSFYQHGLASAWIALPEQYSFSGNPVEYWKTLKSRNNNASLVIISSEELSRCYPDRVDFSRIKTFIENFEEMKIVFVVRNQIDFLQSVYLEINRGQKTDFARFLDESLLTGYATGLYLDYSQLYLEINKSFDKECIQVISFSDLVTSKEGLVGAFYKKIGVPLDSLRVPNIVGNPSINPLVLYVARSIFNKIEITSEEEAVILKCFEQEIGPKKKYTLYSREEFKSLAAYFASYNFRFAALVNNKNSNFTFPRTVINDNYIFRDDISADLIDKVKEAFHRV
ncbi:sulfotransferase [Desulfovibrio sulfodismutans]|uniref:Sulfotransferase n=1 Tax=Desulfolutivibrio sulfodismutans TaxID=63561 RepID=A0A7K3NP36_9BACT|nr:sulfotransferase [Desulfolutivibrio sulfodismutans]NDY57954.1 sulfotransferase [Desulfolutivibrio sulfodismutans]QLA14624.1 hypothetical protein GD606_19955 [Desulfolutivibrio sulfodismutans DSM 3696]